jgi:molybdopterin molybdotransferase
MKMRPFGRLISAQEAKRRLLAATLPVRRREIISLDSGLGRVSAETVRAPFDVPGFARATWDGYALRSPVTKGASARTPVRLKIVGEVFAEQSFDHPVRPTECVAIATGGAMPSALDAVVIFELVKQHRGHIEIRRPVRRGSHVSRPGEDFPKGFTLLKSGQPLTPAGLGALATIGRTRVRAFARPHVTVIPNGNELVQPGGRLRAGQIFECNNLTLGAIARSVGAQVRTIPPVRDQPELIERAIRKALPWSDLLLVTGGSSVGERDFLPRVFPRLGRILFHGVSVRPGKPTLAVRAGGKLVIGMPGHPTSCLSNGFWLVLPVLRKLAGLPGPGWVDGPARLAKSYDSPTPGFTSVIPLRVKDGWGWPTFHDSSAITSLSGANAFALVEGDQATLPRGVRLNVHFLAPPLAVPPGE